MKRIKNSLLLDNLRTARINKGWTQRQVAEKAGVCGGTIGAMEARRSYPSFGLFFKLCELYEVEPGKMLSEVLEVEK